MCPVRVMWGHWLTTGVLKDQSGARFGYWWTSAGDIRGKQICGDPHQIALLLQWQTPTTMPASHNSSSSSSAPVPLHHFSSLTLLPLTWSVSAAHQQFEAGIAKAALTFNPGCRLYARGSHAFTPYLTNKEVFIHSSHGVNNDNKFNDLSKSPISSLLNIIPLAIVTIITSIAWMRLSVCYCAWFYTHFSPILSLSVRATLCPEPPRH